MIIINWLNIIRSVLNTNQGFVMCVLTACYVFCTVWIILDNRGERKVRLNREIVDKIYIPLGEDLKRLKAGIQVFENLGPGKSLPWRWETLKENYIAYALPKKEKIFDDLENFTLRVRKYQNLGRQRGGRLVEVVTEEEKKKVSQLGSRGPWSLWFEGKIGGKYYKVDLFKLLFWDHTLAQDKERFIEKTPDIANEELTECKVVLGGTSESKLTENDFEEMNTSIRKNSEDCKLQQLVKEARALYQDAEFIENKIDKLIEKTSKEIS